MGLAALLSLPPPSPWDWLHSFHCCHPVSGIGCTPSLPPPSLWDWLHYFIAATQSLGLAALLPLPPPSPWDWLHSFHCRHPVPGIGCTPYIAATQSLGLAALLSLPPSSFCDWVFQIKDYLVWKFEIQKCLPDNQFRRKRSPPWDPSTALCTSPPRTSRSCCVANMHRRPASVSWVSRR